MQKISLKILDLGGKNLLARITRLIRIQIGDIIQRDSLGCHIKINHMMGIKLIKINHMMGIRRFWKHASIKLEGQALIRPYIMELLLVDLFG